MAIKKIQLRGISRTPSDRMTSDGGCAESLNVCLDQQELVPIREAVAAPTAMQPASGYETVFIHKTEGYTHIIMSNGSGLYYKGDTPTLIYAFDTGEVLRDIKSIGNTLMVLTNQRMEWVLFDGDGYVDVGDRFPELKIKVGKTAPEQGDTVYKLIDTSKTWYTLNELEANVADTPILRCKMLDILGFLCGYHFDSTAPITYEDLVGLGPEGKKITDTVMEALRGAVNENARKNLAMGFLSKPVFVRYAFRLANGEHIMHSAPILIEPDGYSNSRLLSSNLRFIFATSTDESEASRYAFSRVVMMNTDGDNVETVNPYKLHIHADGDSSYKAELGKWSNIITGVDIYCSEQIERSRYEIDNITGRGWSYNGSDTQPDFTGHSYFTLKEYEDEEDRLTSYSRFYLIKSMTLEQFVDSVGQDIEIEDYYSTFGETLVTKDLLGDDVTNSHVKMTPNGINVFNGRLLASGVDATLPDGYLQLPSVYAENAGNFHVRYFIKDTSGVIATAGMTYQQIKPGTWLFYPDPRCFKAEIYKTSGGTTTVTAVAMKEDKYLNGAYYFAGWQYDSTWDSGDTVSSIPASQPTVKRHNRLYQSDALNPFYMMNERIFTGTLLGVAPVTRALSAGQYGYADLYVFTDGGIWTLAAEKNGAIGDLKFLSQDVAIEGTVCPIDQGIVFTTGRGVMLLTGSDLTCLSDNMNGESYRLESSVSTLLQGDDAWRSVIGMVGDGTTFMQFMRSAKAVYDYSGRRLLFFNASKGYAYVYCISTSTWHKNTLPAGRSFSGLLNSYPEAYVSASYEDDNDTLYEVLDFSTMLGEADDTEYRAVIVTRPVSFDEDDIRKSVLDLRIRGSYDRGKVKYLLLGSMDDRSWNLLHSLRGSSWKYFRFVILARLTGYERITYIEAEYETRLTGRLR